MDTPAHNKQRPTESELEILRILWKLESATVKEVHEMLAATKNTGYTTTLKTMQIMKDKGLLYRDTASRQHIYKPAVTQEQTQKDFLGKMIDGLFSGSASRLVIGALNNKQISPDELQEIKDYLEQFENKKK